MFGTKENAELFWVLFKALFSVEEPASVEEEAFHYASHSSGDWEDKHFQMDSVLGWWSLVLFELSI